MSARGPAGIFTALEMLRRGSKKKIVMVEKGRELTRRSCPKSKTGSVHELQARLPHHHRLLRRGRVLGRQALASAATSAATCLTLIGERLAQETIDYADSIYLEFGADEHIEGIGNDEKVRKIRARAIKAGLKLVDCPIRHLGTEKAHDVYLGHRALADRPRRGDAVRHRMHATSSWTATSARGVYLNDGHRDFESARGAHRRGHGPPRRGLAREDMLRARRAAPAEHRRHRRARRGAQRDNGGDKRRPLRDRSSSATRSPSRTRCAPSARTPAAS